LTSIVKLNGQPVPDKAATWTAPRWVWDDAANKKKAKSDECFKRYGHL